MTSFKVILFSILTCIVLYTLTGFYLFGAKGFDIDYKKGNVTSSNPVNTKSFTSTNSTILAKGYHSYKEPKEISVFSSLNITFPLNYSSIGDKANYASRSLCTMKDLVQGKWILGKEKEHPPYIPMKGEVHTKTCPKFEPDKTWQEWEWAPNSNCEFSNSNFDEELYCSLAINKTIAIIGDSISLDHFLSLTHLLGVPQALPRVRNINALLISNVCNGTSTLIGRRDYYLTSVSQIIDDHAPDILILNRGAHYRPDFELIHHLNHSVVNLISNWQESCRKNGRGCHFVWRTTVPGHLNCSKYSKPSNNIEEMEKLVSTSSQHNWDKFKDQNKLVLDLFK